MLVIFFEPRALLGHWECSLIPSPRICTTSANVLYKRDLVMYCAPNLWNVLCAKICGICYAPDMQMCCRTNSMYLHITC